MINLAVVIPNYNGLHYLPECLKSLDDQDFPVEVIIVDNGSRDGSVDYIKENSDKFKENHGEFTLIENQENLGFSKAINQGINTTNAEYVFLLNNDVELEPGCISNLVECIKQDDMIFSVASMMVQFEDRGKLDDAGDEYTILGWTKKAGEGKSPDKYRKRREMVNPRINTEREGKYSAPVPGQPSIGKVSWIKSDTSMRTSSPTWKMWISATGRGSMDLNVFTALKQLSITEAAGPAAADTMNLK